MFKPFNIRQLLMFWSLGSLILSIGFLISTKHVLEDYHQYQSKKGEISAIDRADILLKELAISSDRFEMEMASLQPSKLLHLNQSAFAYYMDSLCKSLDLRMVSLPKSRSEGLGVRELATIECEVEGNFAAILTFLHQIEYQDRIAVIQDALFDRRTFRSGTKRENRLIACIVLKRLIPK